MTAYIWFLYAIGASLMWGISYVLTERILKDTLALPFFLLLQSALGFIIYAVAIYFTGGLKPGLGAIQKEPQSFSIVFLISVLFCLGTYFLFAAIQLKNASLVSLVEITYPIFVVLFAWLLFRDIQINLYQFLGGLMVLLGSSLVIWKS